MSNGLRDKARRIVKNKIITSELKPGDEIREGSIAKELSMGRTFVSGPTVLTLMRSGNERKSLRRRT